MLFFVSVLTANAFFIIFFPGFKAVGISGFIYGLIGALMVKDPFLKVLMPIGLISIPAPVIIAGPVIAFIEFLFSFTVADGVAHAAHLGGFIAGLILGFISRQSLI